MKKKSFVYLASFLLLFGLISTGTLYADKLFNEKKAKIIEQGQMGGGKFKFVAINESDSKEVNVNVKIEKDNPTLEDLEAYRDEMQDHFNKLKNNGYDKIPVTITMRTALSPQDFESIVKENGLDVDNYEVRVIDEKGMRATLGARPEGGDIYPEQRIKDFIGKGKTIKGVYLFKGKMPVKQEVFDKLSNDQRIFVVDVSEKVLENKIKNSTEYKKLGNDKHIDVNLPHNLYWKLEDLKVVK